MTMPASTTTESSGIRDFAEDTFGEGVGDWLDPGGFFQSTRVNYTPGTMDWSVPSFDQGYSLGGRWTTRFGNIGEAAQQRQADFGQAMASRAQQQQLADYLATGGPTAGTAQLMQGLDRAQGQAMSMAASQRGGIAGANVRDAMRAQADMAGQANQQAAILRAQEQQQNLGQRADLLGTMRQQDYMQVQAQQQQQQMNDQYTQYFMSLGMSADQARMQAELAVQQQQAELLAAQEANSIAVAQGNAGQAGQEKGGLLGAVGSLVEGLFISDERLKTDIDDAGDDEMREFLDALSAKRFRYKDEDRHGAGEFLGFMAQDLEKSELGRLLVVEEPDGKAVDAKRALMAALAANASLHERVSALEGTR